MRVNLARFCVFMLLLAAGATATVAHQRGAPAVDDGFLTGQLLIAAPEMGDSRFAETVIYIVRHDHDGAMGLIVNRELGSGPFSLFLETIGVDPEGALPGDVHIQYGGPVEPGRGFVLHSDDFMADSSQRVAKGLALSVGTDILGELAQGKGPRQWLIMLGYAGWGPGQLEGEMARSDWLTAPADPALIFSKDQESVWKRAMDGAGVTL